MSTYKIWFCREIKDWSGEKPFCLETCISILSKEITPAVRLSCKELICCILVNSLPGTDYCLDRRINFTILDCDKFLFNII